MVSQVSVEQVVVLEFKEVTARDLQQVDEGGAYTK
jgi:hypothetical protein